MRAAIGLVFLFTLGALTMQATADEPKKDPPKKMPDPNQSTSYNEKVSVRRFVNGQLLKNPTPNVPMFRWEKDGALKFYTQRKGASTPTKNSEITDEKGNVYLVEAVFEAKDSGFNISTVKLKPKN